MEACEKGAPRWVRSTGTRVQPSVRGSRTTTRRTSEQGHDEALLHQRTAVQHGTWNRPVRLDRDDQWHPSAAPPSARTCCRRSISPCPRLLTASLHASSASAADGGLWLRRRPCHVRNLPSVPVAVRRRTAIALTGAWTFADQRGRAQRSQVATGCTHSSQRAKLMRLPSKARPQAIPGLSEISHNTRLKARQVHAIRPKVAFLTSLGKW